ncbi:MAG: chromophore lyase CpcT/CpeT [Cyanobacteria bacterium J06614_10]
MKRLNIAATIALSSCLFIASSGQASEATVEAVVAHLEGVMDTTEQANHSDDFVGVQMTTCRVEVTEPETTATETGGVYLYQEQALVESLASPYRQRFLHIVPGDNYRIASHSFKPDSPEALVGLCEQPSPRAISAADMGEQVCTVSLRASAVGGFVGSTPLGGCVASVRGAVSITNVVVLHEDGMDTWDRGFDAAGTQVWGADSTPYQYRWQSE